ncbi:hypothetical protein NP493_153g11059 [Ridgeia piscesae]|uniref:Uncharacterized protein n=1 Tax=Ridgeia piscesae TaxID=27915 RepID=A0AAD9UFZ3_RIDPI|nr:hypothetical protein NP493_153g11059 [Ridgeia piscesae]
MFSCKCVGGYTGTKCETDIDECLSNHCENGGTCSTPQLDMFSCKCAAGYTGTKCGTDADKCSSSPCQNGATCSMPAFDMYNCECLAGYTGTNCETDIDECLSNQCENGGTCTTLQLNMFSCKCAAGYTGTTCETGPLCRNSPCKNGGTCTENGRKRTCKCFGSFTGLSCEKSFVDTLPDSEKARLTVSVKLVDKKFSYDLTDKSSKKYKELKKTVVEALKLVLDVKLGFGKYEIDGVTFRNTDTTREHIDLIFELSAIFLSFQMVLSFASPAVVSAILARISGLDSSSTMITPRLALMLFYLMVAHSAACHTLSNAFVKSTKTGSGSIVVKYEVVVPTNESTAMQSNIVAAIKKHKGPFAGSTLDGNYVSTAKTTAVMYYAQFRVPGLDYIDNYGVNTSADYAKLANEVKDTVSGIYKADENVGSRLINITDVTFRKGSVIVDFVLWVDSTVSSKDVLHDILSNAPFNIGGQAADLNSVKVSAFPWLPVILGVVSAVVLIVILVLAVRKCNTNRLSDVSSDVDSPVYRTTFPKQDRLWRQIRPRMPAKPNIDPQYQLPGRWTHHPAPTYVRGQRETTNQRSQRDQWSRSTTR